MRFQRLAIIGAVCWTVFAGIFLMLGPTYVFANGSYGFDSGASKAGGNHFASHFEIGAEVTFLGLVFPVVLATAPLVARSSRRGVALVTGTLLLVFSVLGARSGGVFYLPAAILLLVSAIPHRDHARAT